MRRRRAWELGHVLQLLPCFIPRENASMSPAMTYSNSGRYVGARARVLVWRLYQDHPELVESQGVSPEIQAALRALQMPIP